MQHEGPQKGQPLDGGPRKGILQGKGPQKGQLLDGGPQKGLLQDKAPTKRTQSKQASKQASNQSKHIKQSKQAVKLRVFEKTEPPLLVSPGVCKFLLSTRRERAAGRGPHRPPTR